MPTVPTVDAPTQSASGAPLSISAPPEAFGGNVVAEGLSAFGKAAGAESDVLSKHAEQFQAINNKSEADAAFVTHLQSANQFAAEYQANNRGMSAYNNLPDAYKTLGAQRDAIAGTLSNPMARAMFDADSRRATANITGELTRFAVTQRKDSVLKTASAVQEALTSDTAIHPDNFDANAKQGMEQQALINDQLGLSPEQGDLAARIFYGNMVANVTKVMADNGDVIGASAFLDNHKDGMDGKVYVQTLSSLRPALQSHVAATIARGVVDSVQGDLKGESIQAAHGFFTGSGWTPEQAAGIVANLNEESGVNPSPSGYNDAGHAYGVAQWHEDRQADFEAWAGHSIKTSTLKEQLGFVNYELTQGKFKETGARLKNAKTPEEAAAIMMTGFERPEDQSAAAVAGRGKTAREVFEGVQNAPIEAPAPLTSTELVAQREEVLRLADQRAEAAYPNDDVMKARVEQQATSLIDRKINAAKGTEYKAHDDLALYVEKNNVQDLDTLLKVPGALSSWNMLPANQRQTLLSDMKRNANVTSPEAFGEIARLNGLRANAVNDPASFLNEDIAGNDTLPQKTRLAFMKSQQQLRAKSYTGEQSDAITNRWMSTPQVSNALNNLNVGKMDSDAALQFRGMLSNDIHVWSMARDGKLPTDAELPQIVSGVVAQLGKQKTVDGHKRFELNPPKLGTADLLNNAEIAAIRQQAIAQGYNPSQADLDAIYRGRHNAK